ncbi:GNAT family N-acetyltransferase [Parenemella sanctibonifatiensis]|uniref:GNAT family N-acetyltransferase n=1 Tax=Parenemella sanctibonifatiensis TaxID=2016505 RepID=A0A255EHY1_9ACTN|nr:GNAT family N-acetyltransferase [Parenemella sanctibonifatiensis]OYN91127.1 GNAT family N-acetyltransferase [Parenemella sanctibonifatiensis]
MAASAPYPPEWETDVVLSDGGTAHLRPILPDDRQRLVDFYARVSDESKYLRFFAPRPVLSEADLDRFTIVDHDERVALILTVGTEMIAVGRYDRIPGSAEAEVAFLVQDDQQGRGVGQLLLEHLAQVARERGVGRFVADVLPQNSRMVAVFADAGYHVKRSYEEGMVVVEFPIEPSETSTNVMLRREHRAEAASVRRVLTPHQIAVLAPDQVRSAVTGSMPGFAGSIITLDQATGKIDQVVISSAIDSIEEVVRRSAEVGAHSIVVLGDAGQLAATQLIELARSHGLRAVGPNSLGLINTSTGLNLTPLQSPRPGTLGVFCQSTAIGVMLLSKLEAQSLGISSFVSTGPLSDVSVNDVMQYWSDDPATTVCLLSLDSIGNPRKFTRIARRLARTKPLVVLAPSRSRHHSIGEPEGPQAAPPDAIDAIYRQLGVIVCRRRDEMLDVAEVLTRQPLPQGRRVAAYANSSSLLRQMASFATHRAGLDCVEAQSVPTADDLVAAVRAGLEREDTDAVIAAHVDVYSDSAQGFHDALSELARTSEKPVLGVFVDFTTVAGPTSSPDGSGTLPVFEGYGDALQALARAADYQEWLTADHGVVPELGRRAAAARGIVEEALAEANDPLARVVLDPDRTAALLAAYGITLVPRTPVATLQEALDATAALPSAVIKATEPALRASPDLTAVFRHISGAEQVRQAWTELGRSVAGAGLGGPEDQVAAGPVVQKQGEPGVSVRITSVEDPAYGPVLGIGLSGIASELLGDLAYRVPPLTTADAESMLRDLKGAPALFGRFGAPPVDTDGVADLITRVAQLADDLPQAAEILLTPCIASHDGVEVMGARIVLTARPGSRDPLSRSLQ